MLWGVHFMVLRGVQQAAALNTIATVAKIVPIGLFALPYTIIVYPIVFVVFPRLYSVCKQHGYVTAADFVRGRYGSPWLALAIAVTGLVATMPYIALQLVGLQVVIGAMAVIYAVGPAELPGVLARHLDWAQAYSFMLFTLIYTPCVSAIATIRNESKSLAFTVLSVVWPLIMAWTCCFVFYQLAHRLVSLT